MDASGVVYRLRKRREGDATVAVLHDDVLGVVAAECRFTGRPAFARLEGRSPADGSRWRTEPNRKFMPTSWSLEADGGAATVFSRDVGRALLNPWGRLVLTLRRQGSGDTLRVVDASPAGVGRALNLERSDWVLTRGEEAIASFGYASEPVAGGAEGGRGPIGKVRSALRALAASHPALVSRGSEHALPPAEALVLLLLLEELTQTS